MRIVKLVSQAKQNILSDLLKRDPNQYGEYAGTVQEIVEDVKKRGDEALFEYTRKFDHAEITPENIRVTEEEIREAMESVDEKLLKVMKKSMANIPALLRLCSGGHWYTTANWTFAPNRSRRAKRC